MTKKMLDQKNKIADRFAADVRLAQSGDAQALSRLIQSNLRWIRGTAYAVLGDAHLAEDAAQHVCMRITKYLPELYLPENFRPWVYRMTRNVAYTLARRRERVPQPVGIDPEVITGEKICDTGEAMEADERFNAVLESINRLPQAYCEALTLRHLHDLSYKQMSEILGVKVKALEIRLVRARKMLQTRLGRQFERRRKRDPGEYEWSGCDEQQTA
jgi:RNA polymerase sigma-70 factor (ECF subfamily)